MTSSKKHTDTRESINRACFSLQQAGRAFFFMNF